MEIYKLQFNRSPKQLWSSCEFIFTLSSPIEEDVSYYLTAEISVLSLLILIMFLKLRKTAHIGSTACFSFFTAAESAPFSKDVDHVEQKCWVNILETFSSRWWSSFVLFCFVFFSVASKQISVYEIQGLIFFKFFLRISDVNAKM